MLTAASTDIQPPSPSTSALYSASASLPSCKLLILGNVCASTMTDAAPSATST